jgi:hypothetical protein
LRLLIYNDRLKKISGERKLWKKLLDREKIFYGIVTIII